jgi:hypothetical protein
VHYWFLPTKEALQSSSGKYFSLAEKITELADSYCPYTVLIVKHLKSGSTFMLKDRRERHCDIENPFGYCETGSVFSSLIRYHITLSGPLSLVVREQVVEKQLLLRMFSVIEEA